MAQFLNQEPNPQEKDSAKGATLKPAPARVDWNDAGDNGLNALERASLLAQAKTPATTAGESFASGMGNSIVGAAIRKAFSPAFDQDLNFDAKQTLSSDTRAKLYAPNQEEIEYLHDSVSVEDYNYRMQQMLEQRDRDRLMADNTVAGFAGMLVGDSPFILAPVSAAGIAGRTGLAVRSAIRAADVGTAMYAQDQLGQSAAVTALIAGVAGLDQLWDMSRAAKAAARARTGREPAFDTDAPTTRTARDANVTGVGEGEDILTRALDESIPVSRNNTTAVTVKAQHVIQFLKTSTHLTAGQKAILDTLGDAVNDIDFKLVAGSANRSRYTYSQRDLALRGEVSLRAPKSANGTTWETAGDALRAMDAGTSRVAVHELIHAATARAVDSNPELAKRLEDVRAAVAADATLTGRMRYYASDVHEMLAGLGDSPEWVEYLARTQSASGKSVLRQVGEYIMNALGIKAKGSALEDVLDAYEDAVKWTAKDYADQAQSFRSEAFQDLAGSTTLNEAKGAQAMLDGAKSKFATMFSLYDNIAQGNEDLAKLLVSDATAVGGRKPSVVDFKRNLTLEMDASASIVEDAIIGALRDRGVGMLSRFFHRQSFRTARAELEGRLGTYLDSAYSAEVHGRPVPVPDAEIAPLVDAYRRSGWAGKWYEHMRAAGLVDDGALVKSDYYFPRQYSYDKMRQGIMQGNTLDDYRALFRYALRDVYPSMESETVQRVAKEMVDGIYNGRAGQSGPMWRQLINGMGNDEVVMAMRSAGVDESAIQSFLTANVRESGSTSPARNLRQRTRFNMDKEYLVNGKSMRMQDLMDTDVAKVMHGYTNRMSGRVGMAYAGVQDLGQLGKMIDESKHTLANPAKWEKTVNDTIDFILGGAPADAGQLPDLLRAAGNMANATMLKNSGLYQITDTALAMKEFGMTRVLRSMRDQPWFKEGSVAINTPDMASRLDVVLRGNIQRDMRFRWLNTYADDNLDLTRQASWFNVTQNVGQAARHVNGMSMVHRLQVNLNSGIVADELTQMFKGDAEAFKRLERFGLTREVADRAIAANRANPGAMFQPDLQMQVEVVGTRMMDYVVQQVRTGETSHFAQFNPIGKLIVGYQSFALAATNKILRRELNDAGWIGVAHIMAYQFPLMLLATMAKHSMDGKDSDTSRLISEAALGMSAIGGISMLSAAFLGDTPRHSLASMSYITGVLGALQGLATGDSDIKTFLRLVPLIQEFAPTRAIINNFGDD
ncbi:putative internal core protein [Klebsiella phage NTUH-K2044-K1-1]|uniref:Putative internal core protein n=1 Tax=Klebsiella phage NTUH-K2044-K1-1 TaxID=1194091 RepID=A0A068Q5K2_BPKNT|nr:internal virion protein with endolysin domain [Klebsiella phage NTUH-K2044-K1-1]BAP15739.1 putative internal core protein [Klebsiella phage NTUH-K2044-K1-1]